MPTPVYATVYKLVNLNILVTANYCIHKCVHISHCQLLYTQLCTYWSLPPAVYTTLYILLTAALHVSNYTETGSLSNRTTQQNKKEDTDKKRGLRIVTTVATN